MIGEAEYIRRYCENELETIPSSWSSVNFEKIIEDKTDSRKKTPKSKFQEEGSIPVVDQGQELIAGYIDDNKKIRTFNKPVIVFGDHTLAFKFIDFDFAQGADGVRVLYPPDGLESNFLYYYFKYLPLPHKGYSRHFKYLRQCQIALPPSKEQERIVQKIESCFEKIDETESSLNKVEKLLEKYRESLLAKAFRGELISQNPDDEPASVLLSKIRAEREKAETSKKKKVQAFAPITDDEKPFDIPESWEWVRLGEVCERVIDGNYGAKYPKAKELLDEGIPFMTAAVVDDSGNILWNKMKYISEEKHAILLKAQTTNEDIVLTNRGARVGAVAILRDERLQVSNIGPQLTRINVYSEYISNDFIYYFLRSVYFQRLLMEMNTGSAMNFINLTKTANMTVPLPPLEEQLRLVETLNSSYEEFSLPIKALKKMLIKMKESVLLKAFEGRLVEQIESEGTGQELLEKILKAKAEEAPKKKVAKKKVAKKTAKKKTTKKK